MTWRNRQGEIVFRKSPDSAWPLGQAIAAAARQGEACQSGAVQQAHRPDYSAKVKRVNLKVVS